MAYFARHRIGRLGGCLGGDVSNSVAVFFSTVFIKLFKFISIPIISVSIPYPTLASLARSQDSEGIFKHTIFYTLLTTLLWLLVWPGILYSALFSGQSIAHAG